VVVWGLSVVYPVLLCWALLRYGLAGGATVGVASALLWGARAALAPRGATRGVATLWTLPAVVVVLSGLTLLTEDQRLLLALPVLVNLALLVGFGASLRADQTYIERIARLQEPELSPAQVRHCRQFTKIWVAFFAVNGAVTAALAVSGALLAWTVYTSAVSYVLIALLLAAEWVVRRRRFGGAERRPGGTE
jgi:uncharacterized membrane protein